MSFTDLPTLNSVLNTISFVLLVMGYNAIRKGDEAKHRKLMIAALISSALFLTSYLIYHANVGSVHYPHSDWRKTIYLIILLPHIVFAALNVPFILTGVILAFKGKFEAHRRLMKWVLPVWMYVSISGVAVYLMLYVIK